VLRICIHFLLFSSAFVSIDLLQIKFSVLVSVAEFLFPDDRQRPSAVTHYGHRLPAAMSARKKLMEEIYDQFLVCKICDDVYSRPKTLSCLHTFCESCITKQHDTERQRAYRCRLRVWSDG